MVLSDNRSVLATPDTQEAEVQTEREKSDASAEAPLADLQVHRNRKNTTELIVMQNGAIVEQGTHTELMASKGHYFQVVSKKKQSEKQPPLPAKQDAPAIEKREEVSA